MKHTKKQALKIEKEIRIFEQRVYALSHLFSADDNSVQIKIHICK
jgi:hypothetical protein